MSGFNNQSSEAQQTEEQHNDAQGIEEQHNDAQGIEVQHNDAQGIEVQHINAKPLSTSAKIKKLLANKVILGCFILFISILITGLIVLLYKLITPNKKTSMTYDEPKEAIAETKAPIFETASPAGSKPIIPYTDPLKWNSAIRCSANELRNSNGSIYRYIGKGTARWYPSPNIASSWDPNWGKYDSIDCANMRLGPDMTYNIASKPIGAPIRCIANELRGVNGSIYRNVGESTLSWYPDPDIASSWDPNWGQYSEIDCRGLTLGPAMAKR